MKNPEKIPERLAKGTTYLLPKTSGTNNPKRQTIYLYHIRMHTLIPKTKIIATVQTDRIYHESYGCKDRLLINGIIIENCNTKKRNLITACIYYPNKFDSVPHSWIIKTLDIYKVSPVIIEMGMSTKLINTFSNVW